MDNRKQQTDTPTPGDVPSSAFASVAELSSPPELTRKQRKGRGKRATPSSAFASAEETSPPPELQGNRRKGRKGRGKRATDEEEGASSDEEIFPGAVAMVSEPRDPSARSEPSLIIAELAEPYQEDEELRQRNNELEQADEELRRRNQELELIVNGAVQGTVIVENSGGGDDDQNAASSPSARKGTRFIIRSVLALLLVVGVILGVTIPLTTNSPKACTRLDCLAEILLQNEVSGAEALQDDSSPQFRALRWLTNEDTAVLDLDSTPTMILVERYVLAVLYFATSGESWLTELHFLSASSVCEWNTGERGVVCNEDDSVGEINLSKTKHEEVIVLISKFRIDSPVSSPFCWNRSKSTHGYNSERTRRTYIVDSNEARYVHWFVLLA
jgi:hypothetical protein